MLFIITATKKAISFEALLHFRSRLRHFLYIYIEEILLNSVNLHNPAGTKNNPTG